MSAAQFGCLIGALVAMSLLFAEAWLVVSKSIPPLRNKLGVSYGIAIAVSFSMLLVATGGPVFISITGMITGMLLCTCLLFWQFKLAQKKQKIVERHNPTAQEIDVLMGLFNEGRFTEAAALAQSLTASFPHHRVGWAAYGAALQQMGRSEEALEPMQKAVAMSPDYAEAHSNLGNALRDLGRFEEAVASCRRATEIKPDFAAAHNNLGNALKELGQFDDAVASYRKALKIKPDFAEAHSNLGVVLNDLGRMDEAAASYRRALEIKPDFSEVRSNLLFGFSHNGEVDAPTLFAEHCRFGEHLEGPLRANWPQHTNTREPDRCLQVGFVSGDLRQHAVASFIEPLLVYLANCPQLSLHAYCNNIEDSVTRRLCSFFKYWHPVIQLSDDALAKKIRSDDIDILIDLSGHSAKHRLPVFARKPAPVQASWMGYPGTTGLGAMDYYLADRHFLPPGQFDDQFIEKLVHLPVSAPFLPVKDAPPVNALPALNNGYVTFGSFNHPRKINRPVIALWSELLRAMPETRMVLGAMPQKGENNRLIEWFAQESIDINRLSFHERCSMEAYFCLHHQVDFCLDTFPYNGGTTSMHALWMGVPTLTLAGNTVAGRPGASILGHVGLDDFIARNAEDFMQKGLFLAGNLTALSDIRAGLRDRFTKSAMGQPELAAAGVERALRIIWQRWCAGLPPERLVIGDDA